MCVPFQAVVERLGFKIGFVAVPRLAAQASQIAVNEPDALLTADGSAGFSLNCNCILRLLFAPAVKRRLVWPSVGCVAEGARAVTMTKVYILVIHRCYYFDGFLCVGYVNNLTTDKNIVIACST
jgi:hypothetical protein